MAVVLRCVFTAVGARARTRARWTLGAARHWRIDDLSATFTKQFLEGAAIAGRTIAAMTRLIALVLATTERVVARQRTYMIYVYAALLIAFVLATRAFLDAALLATSIIGTRRQLATLDHLIHVATAAFYRCLLKARRAIAQMTFARAFVRI